MTEETLRPGGMITAQDATRRMALMHASLSVAALSAAPPPLDLLEQCLADLDALSGQLGTTVTNGDHAPFETWSLALARSEVLGTAAHLSHAHENLLYLLAFADQTTPVRRAAIGDDALGDLCLATDKLAAALDCLRHTLTSRRDEAARQRPGGTAGRQLPPEESARPCSPPPAAEAPGRQR